MSAGFDHVIVGNALWKIVTVWPATVIVPVRGEPVVLASTLRLTVPLPAPLEPPVTWMKSVLLLTAFHVQVPLALVTLTLVAPPAAPTATLAGTDAHEAGMATLNAPRPCVKA